MRRKRCSTAVKIEGMDATTFYCQKQLNHDGPHLIAVLGTDALNEAINALTQALGQIHGEHP